MDLFSMLLSFVGIAVITAFIVLIVVAMSTKPYPDLGRYETEKYFMNEKQEKCVFPSINDPATLELSVIVPAYNEEERLPVMMDEALGYLEERKKKSSSFSYEVIVVDDGSKDKTTQTAQKYCNKFGSEKVRVLTLAKNRGKGGAIRLGMFSARGRYLLFADADGASKFSDFTKLENEMKNINKDSSNRAVVCGSRAHLEEESIAQRSLFRTILMKGFHFVVWFLCVRGVKDTQCGFKLLTREAAILLFSNLHVERWAFDVDMLFLAQYFNIPVGEVAITWTEIEGSKMVPVFSWIQMGKDIILIRLRYLLGAWKIKEKSKVE
ncbi:dolichyl-phosphate beta-glucosyltransferase-like [Saccostrea echinata]|uniref:dolichyl-phosphate beta-glucosyltransferase-like n=1 Tax=Saccostrea echinata TaxID=191078 RepID=UPI002A81D55F|nr:dolichyl-phosphate beta-glucosyltransferase-like [Saccostrea echinata]XP_061189087.1 dolichyl-phosphate beta-glucosyltransferase-like [Saccostrea echinata]